MCISTRLDLMTNVLFFATYPFSSSGHFGIGSFNNNAVPNLGMMVSVCSLYAPVAAMNWILPRELKSNLN